MVIPAWIWLGMFFLVPLGMLLVISFGTTDIIGRPLIGWNPANYAGLADAVYMQVLVRTVMYAGAVVVITLALGYSAAYTIARFGGRRKNLLLALIILPWFVNYLVRIYAWFQLLQGEGLISKGLRTLGIAESVELNGTAGAVIVGLVGGYLPLMIIPIYATVEGLDEGLLDAAKDLYATGASTFRHVILPLSLPGMLFGCLLVFLLTLGDFATAQILGSPRNYMFGNLIQNQFTGVGALPEGAALSMAILALMAVVLALAGFVRHRLLQRGL